MATRYIASVNDTLTVSYSFDTSFSMNELLEKVNAQATEYETDFTRSDIRYITYDLGSRAIVLVMHNKTSWSVPINDDDLRLGLLVQDDLNFQSLTTSKNFK